MCDEVCFCFVIMIYCYGDWKRSFENEVMFNFLECYFKSLNKILFIFLCVK